MLERIQQASAVAGPHMAFAFQKVFGHRVPPGGAILPSGGVKLVTGEPHPFGNFAIGQADDEVEAIARELAATGQPSCVIFADGLRSEAEQAARQNGFAHEETMPAMAVEIDSLAPCRLPEGYHFERFEPGDDAEDWAAAFAIGYELPQCVADVFSPLAVPIDAAEDADVQFFRVSHEGRTVAVSALIRGHGVAGIYCVATVPEHRRCGLGAFATAEPLRAARKQGYRIGVLQSSSMGHAVYRGLGFEDVGSLSMLIRIP
ncbi:MAG TPA: GNAT family N-acetyltransferase [Fimbriimonadaceae bacterium]|nr:GNAT family N-acetyltransferase [Fimbriimonadaceae bacterium]HRJ96825.1 GNAT family N-acetyltransferase [Fimbriimonadaceae bacterium]